MLIVLVALASQAPASCPSTEAARERSAGWDAYRRDDIATAGAHFAAADSLCPGDHGVQVGLGFVRLRQGMAQGGLERFLAAVRTDSGDADAWYGLGLARARLDQRAPAVAAWRRALRLTPTYLDA